MNFVSCGNKSPDTIHIKAHRLFFLSLEIGHFQRLRRIKVDARAIFCAGIF